MSDMNLDVLSNEKLQDMFTEAFESQISSRNNIGEFEATCVRNPGVQDVRMEVLIVGLAGSPTIDDYRAGRVENSDSVVVDDPIKGVLKFRVDEIYVLNSNDFVAVYQSV